MWIVKETDPKKIEKACELIRKRMDEIRPELEKMLEEYGK